MLKEQPNATHYLNADTATQEEVFGRLGTILSRMHSLERQTYGKLNNSWNGTNKCHLLELENAKTQLAYSADHIPAFRANHMKLLDKLNELESQIAARARYGFIHGELGPDHVFVNDRLEPYLIDIEGSMY